MTKDIEHTPEEIAAFDAGVTAGEAGEHEASPPALGSRGLEEAWATGCSVGTMNRNLTEKLGGEMMEDCLKTPDGCDV